MSTKTSSRSWRSAMVAGWWGRARSQAFMVCWNRSTLPQVVGWLGREFFWMMPSRRSSVSKPLRPPRPPDRRVGGTLARAVSGQGGVGQRRGWWTVAFDGGEERVDHDGTADDLVGADRQGVAGVVVQPGQDLAVAAGGERVVG